MSSQRARAGADWRVGWAERDGPENHGRAFSGYERAERMATRTAGRSCEHSPSDFCSVSCIVETLSLRAKGAACVAR